MMNETNTQTYNKTCKHCGETKSPTEFRPTRGKGVITRPTQCIQCYQTNRKRIYKEYDKQRNEKRRKQWRKDPELRRRNSVAAKKYREKNKCMLAAKTKQRHRKLRREVVNKYGGKCVCCGDSRFEFLAIDHVNNDGFEERKYSSNSVIYRKLRNTKDLLDSYQILCHNCNSAKGYYGYCPHERRAK